MKLKKIIIFLGLIFWPLTLLLANTPLDLIRYLLPALILLFSFNLFQKGKNYFEYPLLFISLIEPKLTLFPLIFALILYITDKKHITLRRSSVVLLISIALIVTNFFELSRQTIFVKDYEAQQKVLRNITLYPNVLTARIFQNKARIIINKFDDNFFTLTDPNNYFFSNHPREDILANQNLIKYPFLAIIPFFIGIYFISKNNDRKFIIISAVAALLTLTLLTNFDRHDFVLWVPVSLIFTDGVKKMAKKKYFTVFASIFLIISFIELIRAYYLF
ncbi:hypothetical protein A3A76_03815 [Candidatus Woesebacteria bacterium RIFCSPLOWO2_01_FULL_39_23]|uniref:Glycosyltransferase RgtA/B/C/D-like domain-containing protein n=1 Tax=Candidatus Woesebacteria bacterium RIFCSPHIGHO2_01_FULL_40_22 TaxID=1802499 RepID=A0A1F7YK52_9BACT|nr:MAG: hypothetical protein A2141_00205 [Candidatus Woesebacteria bacterium RBG_16_40_11]OGM27580.1 MAG: hypothetical protein A2628_02215 [Candidatus Woesebacteria bacterium RIFCSPHIGHO2_01_FULL_40_22]OGM36734.1 MAG: hypothetical protein A3E41_03060 [Candidatus Woesebacteria bacterium RIFCSPHIGHO2_12_FULL_38_9]OGM62754.1 MAG: hypothetical protein A3A76_03815 [Candidatus Woesebacteria bacterium RIFCSPLOWO2_01_FULL_39_23]